ncbi:MAG: hypothetical protein OJJ21_16215 [Ferrovibrio sp.]|uniref:hypothetical protein n=1 Tax=Ferrovibrio sp. TaxID=1917215 RepID=UPI00261F6266|nr:hypothetical protein [Ferrovibrio sp.]MCW0235146.1 hypothetical protein [Ferrovibrio sp.]
MATAQTDSTGTKIGERPQQENPHRWRFFRAGGFDQLRIETGEDLRHLSGLDQKLWLALSCPTSGIDFDRRTLELIDTDKDGRIRAPELLTAVNWTCRMVLNPDVLFAGHSELPLNQINPHHEEGARILASAKRILTNIGKADAGAISPAEAADVGRIFGKTQLNGDGVVPPSAAGEDADTAQVMKEIMKLVGEKPDRGGETGIGKDEADVFFAALDAYLDWWGEALAKPDILPLGEGTLPAVEAAQKLSSKLDDYFFRCRLAAFDPVAGTALNADDKDFAAIADADLSAGAVAVSGFPLARIEAERPLPLGQGVNPAWAADMARLRDAAVAPLLGGERGSLSEDDWREIQARLAPAMDWLRRKTGALVEPLGIARLRAIKQGGVQQKIDALIAADTALAPEFEAIAAVETLARYVRDLVPLLNNFISFKDFYTRRGKATFQVGTLFIDGRSCDLCIAVDDPARHATLAALSRIYLLYCDCTRRGADGRPTKDRLTIAAAVTAGDADQLMVGRNGVFYDRAGNDWDAVITKIVSHPISIREAFWLPFKKVGKFVGDQIEKFATARSKANEQQMTTQLLQTGTQAISGQPASAPAAQPAQQQAFDAGKFAGIFAAIGLAIGAIGTALASVITGFLNLAWWQIPLAVTGVVLIVSGPSMVIAAMKLRQRNLGPLLDANGWAVNARALINIPFGGSLTHLAKLPPGSERALTDPYAEKEQPWGLYLVLVILVGVAIAGWRYGWWARLIG